MGGGKERVAPPGCLSPGASLRVVGVVNKRDFHMRIGLAATLVCLIACVGCRPPKSTREEAIDAIKALGGGTVEVNENKAVVRIDLENTKFTDAGLVHLNGLTKLKELYLFNTKVTVARLEHLAGLTNLTTLHLTGTGITDAGLVHLKELTNLGRLYLNRTLATDAGVKKLQQTLPKCKFSH